MTPRQYDTPGVHRHPVVFILDLLLRYAYLETVEYPMIPRKSPYSYYIFYITLQNCGIQLKLNVVLGTFGRI